MRRRNKQTHIQYKRMCQISRKEGRSVRHQLNPGYEPQFVWQFQVKALLSGGRKAEIEGVASFSSSYLTDAYIPNKICCRNVL
jgi:DNA topoisomerase VI subunit A